VLAVCTAILVPTWNDWVKVPPPVSSIAVQPPGAGTASEGQGPATTETTTTTATEDGGGTNATAVGVTITIPTGASVQGSPDYNPDAAEVPLNDKVIWVNEDTVPHTATSGTGAEDPNSGKIFDTSIINGGQESSPVQITGAKEGDEIPYYCQVHPYMTSKLTLVASITDDTNISANNSSAEKQN
jgi:plastocyanin